MERICEVWPNWTFEELIGTGSYGKVYKAKREKLGYITYAAIKVIEIPGEKSEVNNLFTTGMDQMSIHAYYGELVKNLMNEIKVMESLKTANNIVAIEDFEVVEKKGEIGWEIYIRMELLKPLGEIVRECPLSEQEVIKLGTDICNALAGCEKSNIIHRDIKMDNIFVNEFGTYKLGDFGIARQMERTRASMSQKGTNMYMAPEVFRGESYGRNVDLYSLGVLMYRLLNNGRFPFMPPAPQPLRFDDTEKAMQRRLSGERFPALSGVRTSLQNVIYHACTANPFERYQSASEMLGDLGKISSGEDVVFYPDNAQDHEKESLTGGEEYEDEGTLAAFSGTRGSSEEETGKERELETEERMENRNKKSRKKGSRKKVVVAAVLATVLCIGALGTVLILKHKKSGLELEKSRELQISQELSTDLTETGMEGFSFCMPVGFEGRAKGDSKSVFQISDTKMAFNLCVLGKNRESTGQTGYMEDLTEENIQKIADSYNEYGRVFSSYERKTIGAYRYIVVHYQYLGDQRISYKTSCESSTYEYVILGGKEEINAGYVQLMEKIIESSQQSYRRKIIATLDANGKQIQGVYVKKDADPTTEDYNWNGYDERLVFLLSPGEYHLLVTGYDPMEEGKEVEFRTTFQVENKLESTSDFGIIYLDW